MILADKGDLAAMERLASVELDKMFDFGDVAGQLKNKYISTGSSYLPEGAAVPRLKSAYDAAIANNPQFAKIRDAFFDEDYNIKIGGKAYMPKEPVFGRAAFIKAGESIRGFKESNRFASMVMHSISLQTLWKPLLVFQDVWQLNLLSGHAVRAK